MSDSKLLKEMGKRIFDRRKALHLTQEQLAEKLGVSTQMISNLELGKKAIRPENLARLCEILNISADYVLTGTPANTAVDELSGKLFNLSREELEIITAMVDYMDQKK